VLGIQIHVNSVTSQMFFNTFLCGKSVSVTYWSPLLGTESNSWVTNQSVDNKILPFTESKLLSTCFLGLTVNQMRSFYIIAPNFFNIRFSIILSTSRSLKLAFSLRFPKQFGMCYLPFVFCCARVMLYLCITQNNMTANNLTCLCFCYVSSLNNCRKTHETDTPIS
jgi:hypothetical protein